MDRPFSSSPDLFTDLGKTSIMVSHQLKQVLLVYYQLRQTSPFQFCNCNLKSSRRTDRRSSGAGWETGVGELIAVVNCIDTIILMVVYL